MSSIIYAQDKISDILYPVFKEHNISKALLFGYYVKGMARAESDIDIVVDSELSGLSFQEDRGADLWIIRINMYSIRYMHILYQYLNSV